MSSHPLSEPRCVALAVLSAAGAFLLAQSAPCQQIPARRPRPAAVPALDPSKLAPIVGDIAQWKLSERRPGTAAVSQADGQTVLTATDFPMVLAGTTPVEADSEIAVRFQVEARDKGVTSLTLQSGIGNADDTRDTGLPFTVSTRGANEEVNWSIPNLVTGPGQKAGRNGSYSPGFTAARSLGWPTALRRQVEAAIAAAKPMAKHWFTATITVRPDAAVFALDGIPLGRAEKAGLKTTGFVRLTSGPGVKVASVTVRKLAPENPDALFQTIDLDPIVNSKTIDGKAVDTPAENEVRVGNVPFQLPSANAEGGNHVDVGSSWVREGGLDGGFYSNAGPFGGRWAGALNHDPARLQLRVPGGRYAALHLLAVTDGEADSIPQTTVQFFRGGAGFPVNFLSPKIAGLQPAATATEPALTVGGKRYALQHIVIPIDPGELSGLDDQDFLDMEFTKLVQVYRAYPDPLFHSEHGAGLPSSVQIFAATLERPALDVKLTANAYGHIWTAPLKPEYSVRLHNRTGAPRAVELTLTTTSYRSKQTTKQTQTVQLGGAGKDVTANFKLDPPCYGYHDLKLTVNDGGKVWDETRSLAYLHEDTRERGDWDFGCGALYGFWNWAGGHQTPRGDKQFTVMGQAGAETMNSDFGPGPDQPNRRFEAQDYPIAEKYGIKSYKGFGAGDHYITLKFADDLSKIGLEKATENFLKTLSDRKKPEDKFNHPEFLSFFAEPGIGAHTYVPPADYYNAPTMPFSAAEEARYKYFLNGFFEGAKIVRKNYPDIKNLLPHGDPLFPVPFLRRNPEIAPLLDGVTVDIPAFERLPEMQIHQIAFHRMVVAREEFKKAGIANPKFVMYEGPCLPDGPGALTTREMTDLTVRDSLILQGYGVDVQTGGFGGFDCAAAWGEQHYGNGILYRTPWEMPKPAYAAVATMTRMLNRRNFDGWVPTGSLSTYALRFKHYKTGQLVHVLWTIRGTRPVNIAVPAGSAVTLTDEMDNTITLPSADGQVHFTIDSSPVYLTGLPAEAKITLGEADQSDSAPGAIKTKLTNFGTGDWKVSAEPDTAYEQSHYPYVVRFPAKMTTAAAAAPPAQGGNALGVHLEAQPVDRTLMPYYTNLVPPKPVVIPGKAKELGLWVRASSDWGRVVYSLRDAKGERWLSVGMAGAWNCDDLQSRSFFNFDGWRYLRFELPANAPYDGNREPGCTWWGAYGPGDRTVDLPLTLEKVIVERRAKAMYVNDLQPASPNDVLLGDLYAEYASAQDQTPEAVRLSALRMPVPPGGAIEDNPITRMAQANPLPAIEITEAKVPETAPDGTRCNVNFKPVADAAGYEIWASAEPDGRGALQLAKGWKEPGGLVRGFLPDTDFYLFLVYTDAKGQASKPSPAFKIHLQDEFAQK